MAKRIQVRALAALACVLRVQPKELRPRERATAIRNSLADHHCKRRAYRKGGGRRRRVFLAGGDAPARIEGNVDAGF